MDCIQQNWGKVDGLIVNGGALTHYGLTLKDALIDCRLPVYRSAPEQPAGPRPLAAPLGAVRHRPRPNCRLRVEKLYCGFGNTRRSGGGRVPMMQSQTGNDFRCQAARTRSGRNPGFRGLRTGATCRAFPARRGTCSSPDERAHLATDFRYTEQATAQAVSLQCGAGSESAGTGFSPSSRSPARSGWDSRARL